MKNSKGEKTLLLSVLMSLPGPLIVGIALSKGQTATQLADFVRRTAELAALIVSLVVYHHLHKEGTPEPLQQKKLETLANRCVAIAMCLSGAAMLFIALLSSGSSNSQGNVIPGLVVALLGFVANGLFFFRYRKLNREKADAILAVQARLYLAKTFVDGSVSIALGFVALFPSSAYAPVVDTAGSVLVSVYLLITGAMTLFGKRKLIQAEA